MNASAYFQGVTSFNSGRRFRDNPYLHRGSAFAEEMMAWYEGWSTGFDITWRKLTLSQRFRITMRTPRSRLPVAANAAQRRRSRRFATGTNRIGDGSGNLLEYIPGLGSRIFGEPPIRAGSG